MLSKLLIRIVLPVIGVLENNSITKKGEVKGKEEKSQKTRIEGEKKSSGRKRVRRKTIKAAEIKEEIKKMILLRLLITQSNKEDLTDLSQYQQIKKVK